MGVMMNQYDRLPNHEAIAHFNGKVLLTSQGYAEVKAYEHALAFTVAQIADKDMLSDVHKAMKDAVENGTLFHDFQKHLKPYLMAKGWLAPTGEITSDVLREHQKHLGQRLKTIYHTNKQTAYAAGQWERIQQTKEFLPYLQYMPSLSENKRDSHQRYYGLVRPVDDPIWASLMPPNGFNCFLPETTIQGDLQACVIKSYEGTAIHLTTHDGRVARFTADHPILTHRGWVRADNIKIGDNVISYGLPVNNSFVMPGQIDNDKTIPTAKNLADAFLRDAFAFAGNATLQFNSDVVNGKIHIDITNGGLMLDVWTNGTQGVQQITLIRGDDGRFFGLTNTDRTPSVSIVINDMILSQNSANITLGSIQSFCQSALADVGIGVELQNFSFQFIINRPSNSPRLATLSLHTASHLFDVLPSQYTGLAHVSYDDTLFTELSLNGLSSDLGLFSYLVNTHASIVTVNPVVDVRKLLFSGHVYDFQSSESILSSDGIISHNCKCWVKQITKTAAQKTLDEQAKNGIVYDIEMETIKNPATGELVETPKGVHFSFNHNHDRLTAMLKLAEDKHGTAFGERLKAQLTNHMLELVVKTGAVSVVDFTGIVARQAEVDRLKIELDGTESLSEGVVGDEWQQYHGVILERYNPSKHKIKVARQPADFATITDGMKPDEWPTIDFMMTVDNDKAKIGMNAMLKHPKKGRKAWDNLKLNIQKHLEKSDVVPIDLRHLDDENRLKIMIYVLSLSKEQQKQIVFIKD